MAFKKVVALETDTTISLGNVNKKTGKKDPNSVTGYFLGTKGGLPNKYDPDKPTNLHVFKTPQGNVGVWGKTDLDTKMRAVVPGSLTRVTRAGSRPSKKGNDLIVFEVEVDDTDCIHVDTVLSSPSSSEESSESTYEADSESEYAEEEVMDEVPYTPPTPPTRAVKAPDINRTRALLSRK